MPGLILKIGADVSDAQAALKSIVSDSQTTATKVSSAFGRTPIPTQNIANYNAAINSLKQNVSNVKFTLPDLPKLDTSIDLNTAPAIASLKSVVAEARTTEAKVISLFSTPLQVPVNLDATNAKTALKSIVTSAQGTKGELESVFRSAVLPTTTIDKYSAAITALKTNINSVSFTKLSNVPPVSIPVKVEKVIPQEIKVDTSKAIGNLSELNTVIKSSEVEIEKLAAVSGQPLNTSSIDKYSAAIQSLKANVSAAKIVPVVPSFDASSLSLENAIQKLDNFHRALNNATDPASIKLYEVAIASLETHIAKLNALKSGKPIIDLTGVQAQVAPASAAISQLVAQIEGLKSKALQKLQLLSTQTDIVEIRKLEAEINILLAEITKLGNNAKSIRAIQLPNLNLPLNNIQQYNAAITALKQNLSSVKISVIPVIPTIAPQKVTVDFSDVQKQAGPAIAAISSLGDSIETLRAKMLAKKQFLITETDISKVALLNKEIDILASEITRLNNVGKVGFDAFGNKIIKTTTEIDLLAAQIKKGTGSFTVLGKAGKLSGSTLGSLTGVLSTTRSSIGAIVPQTSKLTSGFLSVAGGASKAFGILRQAAFIIPGIGVAGLIGGLTDLVAGLFRTSSAASEAAEKLKSLIQPIQELKDAAGAETSGEISQVQALSNAVLDQTKSYGERNNALNQLKKINESYFGDLTLEAGHLALLKTRVDEYTAAIINEAVMKKFKDKIADITLAASEQRPALIKAVAQVEKYKKSLSTQKDVLRGAFTPAFDPADISGLKEANANLKEQSDIADAARANVRLLKGELQLAVNESLKFRPLEITKSEGIKGATDEFNKIISKAKEVAAFLKDAFVITYQFNPLDDKATALKKAQNFLKDVAAGDLELLVRVGFNSEMEPTPIREFQEDINPVLEGLKKGIIISPLIFDVPTSLSLNLQANELDDDLARVRKAFEDVNAKLPELNFEAPPAFNFNVAITALRKYFQTAQTITNDELFKIVDAHAAGVNQINKIIQGLAIEGFATFGEALGTALGGGDLKDVFKNFANIVADGLTAIGKQMIAMSPVITALKAALRTLDPKILLPAGLALVAIGAALRNSVSKGIQGFEFGGLVSGPVQALIGEGSGTSRHNPEVIAPLDKLKSMLSDLGGGNRVQHVLVTGRLRGRDMALQNARTSRSNRRLGA